MDCRSLHWIFLLGETSKGKADDRIDETAIEEATDDSVRDVDRSGQNL